MEHWQQNYPGGVAPDISEQGPHVMQSGQMGQPMQDNQADVQPGIAQRQALQQLLQTMKLAQTAEQQQQILSILKANPWLMAALIKHRQQEHQMQMQQNPMQQHFPALTQLFPGSMMNQPVPHSNALQPYVSPVGAPSQDGSGNDVTLTSLQDQLSSCLAGLCLDNHYSY